MKSKLCESKTSKSAILDNFASSKSNLHSDFTWKQFQSFRIPKSCHFDHSKSSEFLLTFDIFKCDPKNLNSIHSKPSNLLKWQFLTSRNQLKLISRKIRMAGKLIIFYAVKYPQLKFLIRLPRSVVGNTASQAKMIWSVWRNSKNFINMHEVSF